MRDSATILLAGVSLMAVSTAGAFAQQRGVTDTTVTVGTHTALTGPVAPWGTGSVNGMRMRFDEANAKGIHGRKIKLVVEDHGYQVPRAIQAANKLLNRDKIFAMVAALGTPMNNAVLPKQLKAGVPNIGPFTGARQMVQPFHKLKFLTFSTYYTQMRAATKHFVEAGKKRICVMYQDSDFGREILDGVVDQLKVTGMKVTATSAHNPREKSFVGALTKLRKAKCEVIAMGTIVLDSIIPYATSLKMGWKTTFVGSVAAYDMFVAGFKKGKVMNGFYAMTSFEMIYDDNANAFQKKWAAAYKAKFGKPHTGASQLGYGTADILVEALKRAGKNLTTDGFVKAMESLKDFPQPLGGANVTYGPKDHEGADTSALAVVQNGKWKTIKSGMKY